MSVNRKQAFTNFLWKLGEQSGAQIVSFLVSVILARLLVPEDYSAVGVVLILTSFCAVFIDGGLAKALIQKKDPDMLDYSTVLVTGLTIASAIYLTLFFSAPVIAQIYEDSLLTAVVRVYSLKLFVGAFNTVQCAYISKKLQFKKYFFATIIGTVISAGIGLWMAYDGFGVWALVAQQMTNLFVDTVVLYITTKFRPQLRFSMAKLKSLWAYGSKVLGTSLLDMTYDNIRPLIVGLKFTPVDLAYYEKGRNYPGILNSTINSTLASVLFPVIASVQEDMVAVKTITQKYIRISSFVVFPMLLGLAAISENLVRWMLTDKWMGIVPYMQIFCVNHMFQLLQTGNLQAINAIGRSDLVFKIAVVKKLISFGLLVLTVIVAPSPYWLALLGIVTSLIAFMINSLTNKRTLNYGLKEQALDILPNLIASIAMMLIVMYIGTLKFGGLVAQILIGGLTYLLIALITQNASLRYCWETFLSLIRHC